MIAPFQHLLSSVRAGFAAADPVWLAVFLVLAVAWLGAAFWGAEVAERRWRAPRPYLLIGLLAPGLGWWLASQLPCQAPELLTPEQEMARRPTVKPRTGGVQPAPQPADLPMPTLPETGAPPAVYAAFFLNLRQGARVSVRQPLYVRYDGNDLLAHAVVDVLEKLVVLDMEKPEGGTARLRVPYAKIEEVKWLKHV